jgi:hypothetical protein
MHRSIRTAFVATCTATAMLAAGCSSTVTGTPAPAGATSAASSGAQATSDPVAWVNGVCGSLLGFTRVVSTPPVTTNSASPEKAVSGLSAYLGNAVSAIDKVTTDLKDVGPSPVAGGDAAITTINDAFGQMRASFQAAKSTIDAVNPSDLSQVATALPAAMAKLEDLSNLRLASDLQDNPELDRAAAQAPNCQALRSTGG